MVPAQVVWHDAPDIPLSGIDRSNTAASSVTTPLLFRRSSCASEVTGASLGQEKYPLRIPVVPIGKLSVQGSPICKRVFTVKSWDYPLYPSFRKWLWNSSITSSCGQTIRKRRYLSLTVTNCYDSLKIREANAHWPVVTFLCSHLHRSITVQGQLLFLLDLLSRNWWNNQR